MIIDQKIRTKIKKVLVYFETGKLSDYGSVYAYSDGKGGVPQVTLSVGFTQDYNLKQVLVQYCKNNGKLKFELFPYIKQIKDPLLYQSKEFLSLLKAAGDDPIMQRTQDDLFQRIYVAKAEAWANEQGFQLPLSLLVIADSFLQSGKVPMEIRMSFSERTPLQGGDERRWITSYIAARTSWLLTRKLEAVRLSVYRTKCFKEAVILGNWRLMLPINANGQLI